MPTRLSVFAALLLALPLMAADPVPQPTQDRLAWWREARFGMFIHWGLYAIPGKGEWQSFGMDQREYRRLMESFNPTAYDPTTWAAAAKDAGMGYVVLTARHHDGFALWDSPSSHEKFTSRTSAAQRDLLAPYVEAVRASGLKVGLYYSPMDWRFPGYFLPEMYRASAEAMRDQCHSQVRELLTGYGPIDLLWWDGGSDDWLGFGGLEWGKGGWRNRDSSWPQTKRYAGRPVWESERLMAMVRQLQPALITNDRSGVPGDFSSREQKIGDFDNTAPWEKCATLNNSWGYMNQPPLPLADLLGQLSQTVCRDGNFLLNIGPRADGSLPADQVARLAEIGVWMRANGEAIRGTRGGPLRPTEHYGTTHRGDTVWLHVWSWPADGRLTLEPLPKALAEGATQAGDAVRITTVDGRLVVERQGPATGAPLTLVRLRLQP